MALSAGIQAKHAYQTCHDGDCPLPYCRIYKQGIEEGFLRGIEEGYARGYTDGFPDGIAACPLPNGGG
jgi:hypothetical protein